MILIYVILLLLVFIILFDIFLLIKPKSKLKIIPIKVSYKNNKLKEVAEYKCEFKIINTSSKKETMIPNFFIKPKFFNNTNLIKLNYQKSIFIDDGESIKKINNYWPTIIIKSNSYIKVFTSIKLDNISNKKISYLWLKILWENYGHFGLKKRANYFLINKDLKHQNERTFYKIPLNNNYEAVAIKTNLLGAFDDPILTIEKYCKDLIKSGDILVIGETPLAIMQGRYLSPKNLEYNFFTKILCYFFHPTSSLATACGMQLLINKIGISRVSIALIIGFLFKLFGIKGIFYRLTAPQSSLIDDISGTTIPYDKTIVLGPKNTSQLCNEISSLLNIYSAVVDVNDLGGVKILASSNNSIKKILQETLKKNPAGNDDQKTPILLIRRINN
tara:strand:- start:1515 stop:2678 length:1164 start_codon:yes stop_codon:yes gene_type:complete